MNVLIIEDEALIAEELKKNVECAGFSVIGVYYSAEEVNTKEIENAHIALIDINLGSVMDGFLIAEKLIEHYGIAVIFVTGYSDLTTIRKAAKFVPYGFILKPISEDSIRIALEIAKSRIEAERKSIVTEKRYRYLFETMPAAFALNQLVYDDAGTIIGYEIVESNQTMRQLCNKIGVGNANYLEYFFDDSENDWLEIMKQVTLSGSIKILELFSPALKHWFNVIIYGQLPSECGILMIDITERKELEERLQQLNAELKNLAEYQQKILETERSIIAGNIHDYLGQYLTAIAMDLSYIEKHFEKFNKEKLTEFIGKTKNILKDAIVSMRNLCTDLRADVLENLGLPAAIEWYVHERLKNALLNVTLDIGLHDVSISMPIALHIFRIFQESIMNVLRHSKANNVRIRLFKKAGDIILEIEDDGIGIPQEAFERIDSHGLVGMRERARQCGGVIEFEALQPHGTIVRLVVPLDQIS